MSRLSCLLLAMLLAMLLGPWPAAAAPASPKPKPGPESHARGARSARDHVSRAVDVQRDEVEHGRHWRIGSSQGVLHVWRPPGYRRDRAGIVLFVHGYHVTADRAWSQHHLVEQFCASRQNALFIVVDGPTGPGEPVKFPALGQVLQLVARHARLTLPHGHIVAMGHSAGYRTLATWLDYRFVAHVILLDALYSNENEFFDWITSARNHEWHRLTVVAQDTQPQAQRLMKRFQGRGLFHLKRIPDALEQLNRRQRGASLLFLDAQYGHSALVTNRKVIPVLLRRTRLRTVR